MANRRPIRRFKKRFYGLNNKRPFRWAANTPAVEYEVGGPPGLLAGVIPNEIVAGQGGVPPEATLLSGEFDVSPWADAQEVTIDRVVGSIGLVGSIVASTNPIFPSPVVRLGIIVSEDESNDPLADPPTRSLFDLTDLQEAEWMWLHQVTIPWDNVFFTEPSLDWTQKVAIDIPIDLRVRRKLGQKDNLYLYASYATPNSDALISYTWAVRMVEQLRVGMMSR